MVIVVTLLAFGCPVQAIVQAYGLDDRTVASWRDRAGSQCQGVHQAIVEQGQLDLIHVQADEIRVKARSRVAWMGLAMMVSTRLWLGGVVSGTRDTPLADRLREPSASLLSSSLREAFLYRWLGGVPYQYQTGNTLHGETHSGVWSCLVAGLVGLAHWDGDQTDSEQASQGGRASDESWVFGASDAPLAAFSRRASAQHLLPRTVEWNGQRTAGDVNAQVPPCCSAAPGSPDR